MIGIDCTCLLEMAFIPIRCRFIRPVWTKHLHDRFATLVRYTGRKQSIPQRITWVTPEAPCPLNESVDGGQVTDQEVEIDIQGLFHHLGCNHQPPLPLLCGAV